MNIYSASQIKVWDQYTIKHEPVLSIDLMERAASQCVHWLLQHYAETKHFYIFCGKGNNGGDGLAIARLLTEKGLTVQVYIQEFGKMGSPDFQANLQRLHALPIEIIFIQSQEHFPHLVKDAVVIDALYGSGLNNPLQGLSAELVQHININVAEVIAIDIPSGLFMDASSKGNIAIKATHTLTFQTYKLALLVAENAPFIGEVHLLDIQLHRGFTETEASPYQLIEESLIKQLYRRRDRFAHKGTYGHCLLVGGSYGKTGAMVLSTKACLRSGAGLVTAYVPACSHHIIQTAAPEAMALLDTEDRFLSAAPENLEKYNAVGIGPGMGTEASTGVMLTSIIKNFKKPLVLDADALNCLALQNETINNLPPLSILTPHPKEFERLFGALTNDFERIEVACGKAKELQLVIVLKGHHTLIALPDGKAYFNSTGNAGMAKGGSGDVMTGMITALVSSGYPPKEAAIIGVYLHGLAGDFAAKALSMEAMLPSDLIQFLPQAFLHLTK